MRDVSKILSDADVLAIKALLAQQGLANQPLVRGEFEHYPKILYAPEFVLLQRVIQFHGDPIARKEAKEKLSKTYVVVRNHDEELDYMEDGWSGDLNGLIIEQNIKDGVPENRADPRQPQGREGRMARRDLKAQREQELRDIQRRYLELTGRRIENDSEPVNVAGQDECVVAEDDGPQPEAPRSDQRAARTVPAHVAKAAKKAASPRQARA